MRKRINEVLAETIHEIAAAKSQRTKKPHRQERKARRIVRELNERELQKAERIERAAQRERILNFNDGCRTTAGKKRQGKGREIIATTTGRISYERQQRRTVSYGELEAQRREDWRTQQLAREIITNGLQTN